MKIFLNLCNVAFDKNNNVTLCGREVCKNIIYKANELEPNINHGNLESGFMNVDAVLNLRNRLLNESPST